MVKKSKRLLTSIGAYLCATALFVPMAACGDSGNSTSSDNPTPVEYLKEGETSVTGKQKGFVNNGKYYPDYATLEEERAAAKELNVQVAAEGDVLMKNANDALPLAKAAKVTLLGFKTANIMMGGGGSGSGRPGQYGVPQTTLKKGLEEAGFRVNPATLNYYGSNAKEIGELPSYVQATYKSYDDAAIVMFSRSGSEGSDEKTCGLDGDDKHYLEFTNVEKELIKHAKSKFKKVILLVNSSNAMELAEVNAEKTSTNLGVDAILWIGHTGNDGAAAIGKILSGEVNPSGRTADTYPVDFTKDPTYFNFGSNNQIKDENGNPLDTYIYVGDSKAVATKPGKGNGYNSVEYREGIYVGYRYWETKGEAEKGDWYKNNVVYPFGYGLSYTTFSHEITDDIAPTGVISKSNSTITVKVKVTNTGNAAGKDVVQVYYTAPYTQGGIEKAAVNLAAFGKTRILQPGESEVVTCRFVAQDMASFDWNDANNNGFVGYECEKGDYTISVRSDAHHEIASITRTIENDMKCTTDYTTGAEISSLFTGADGLEEYKSTNDTLEANMMTRANGLQLPKAASKADRTWTQAEVDELESQMTYYSYMDESADPWYVSSVPAGWTQAADTGGRTGGKTATQLYELFGKSYTEPTIVNGAATAATDAGTRAWDEYLNQFTWEELTTLISYGGFGQPEIESIGKNASGAYDAAAHPFWNGGMFGGATEPENQMGTNWCTPAVWGCTWNTDLLGEIGRMTGNEALFFNIEGLYGFSVNIHRSPFGGRNFEYLSEDGLLAGKLAASACEQASAKGLVTYTKHFMMNNQETNRNDAGGVMTWATEQAIREIYGRPYEYAVKEGNNSGFMTAFNRIGKATCSTNWSLLEGLARNEWGYTGHNVTDYMDYAQYRYAGLMVRTGNELPLGNADKKIGKGAGGYASFPEGTWDAAAKTVKVAGTEQNALAAEAARAAGGIGADCSAYETVASPTQWFHVRKAAQRILYSMVNGLGGLNGADYTQYKDGIHVTIDKAAGTAWTKSGWTGVTPTNLNSTIESAVKEADLGTDYTVKYMGASSLAFGEFDPLALTIAGTAPAETGTYSLYFAVAYDGWIYCKLTVTINITGA